VFVRYLKVDTVVIPAFSANGDWYLTWRLKWTIASVGNCHQTHKSLKWRLQSLSLRNMTKLILTSICRSLKPSSHTHTHTHTHTNTKVTNGHCIQCAFSFVSQAPS
jgi:hypothetical protein